MSKYATNFSAEGHMEDIHSDLDVASSTPPWSFVKGLLYNIRVI